MNSNSPIEEIWRDVVGYEGLYQVSDHGRVKTMVKSRRCPVGHILAPAETAGYLRVCLYRDKRTKMFLVHALVAQAFLGERPKDKDVNHIDTNKLNNCLSNLEYLTRFENSLHASQNGRMHRVWLEPKQVVEIRIAYSQGVTITELSEQYHRAQSTIHAIVHGDTWKHTPTPPARTESGAQR